MTEILKRQKTFNNYGTSLVCESVISSFFDQFIEKAHIDLTMPMLDIGCGFGRAAAYLAKKGACQIYALDLCEKNLKKLVDDYPALVNNQTIIPLVGDFSVDSNCFVELLVADRLSLALLINVIHFWDQETLGLNLLKVFNYLAEDGFLLMLVQVNHNKEDPETPKRFNIYPSALKASLIKAGFKEVFVDNNYRDDKYVALACKKSTNLQNIMSGLT
mgnify:CR=1 FL=1